MKKIINIFGDITSEPWLDSDITANKINALVDGSLKNDELEININSYGGEVFEAVTIANILANSPASKTFNILGICASAATMLFSATDTVNISKGAMVMYHKPSTRCWGNSIDFRKIARLLDKMEKEQILVNLEARTGKTEQELSLLIADEWWLTSDEAIQMLGFTDSGIKAIENKEKTKMIDIYQNYISKKKALSNNAYSIFINHKNNLK